MMATTAAMVDAAQDAYDVAASDLAVVVARAVQEPGVEALAKVAVADGAFKYAAAVLHAVLLDYDRGRAA